MIKHVTLILVIILTITTGIFLPYIHGDYDYFAVGISTASQFAAFASLLLSPIGLFWLIAELRSRESLDIRLFKKFTIGVLVVIALAAALGAFVSHNRFSAIIILMAGAFILSSIIKTQRSWTAIPYYLIFVPVAVISIMMFFLEGVKNESTGFVIQQSEQLILDIELYKKTNGHYPASLQSTIEDYRTNVSGIERFHYEPNGEAYNLYFEQFSNIIGTQEIVMYNKLDEHEMTVHNQDLLRIPDQQIIRGYHRVANLPQRHWKIFYFD